MTLAEQLIALCKEHGLNALSVEVHVLEGGEPFFGSYAHAKGCCGSSTLCRETPSDAIGEAIASVRIKIGTGAIPVPVLEAA